MRTLIYKINKIDENRNSELIIKSDSENKVRKEWDQLIPEDGFDYDLIVGWELNGKSLGTTSLDYK